MSDAALPLIDPGPFERIIAFSFPATTFHLRVLRDDGLEFTPDSEEGMGMILYDENWEFLFHGNSWADPKLGFTEAATGLITRFSHAAPYYTITFNLPVLQKFLDRPIHNFKVYLVTEGERSLETIHPRRYADSPDPLLMPPGHHLIRIPFWETLTTVIHPDLYTTIHHTTVHSSVPYTASYAIGNGNALARFRFPLLAVTWSPNHALTGWTYALEFNIQCPDIEFYMPRQTIANMTPPLHPPGSPNDRIQTVYANLVLILGMGACSNLWYATRIQVTTSFGYGATIPFSTSPGSFFSDAITLAGIRPGNLFGDPYIRTHRLLWNSDRFTYNTGHWPDIHVNQIATLEQSPATGFDVLHFQPQPE
ncbi:MAG: hypothetical protein HQL98_12165 [Magnetococcales bacterium]|nr:hypothetical protein [Magnetococcales bacterium]